MKKINDDHKILFYTGGKIFKHASYKAEYTDSTTYNAYYYDLTANTYWHSFRGAINSWNMEFAKISPYEGYIFNANPTVLLTNWWVWDEYGVKFYQNEQERLSLREGFTVAGIPKSSPFLRHCF